ncbi:DNA-3-methyladenine glycosylase family protein [Streptomyces montanisoli]|uniref:DNA-3-methyladenine glycosylase family protein n=1 Tax=Streptomyces montanisoli TaxID=2798581 RepID=UPI0027DC057D|nr:DNA-3-methyladenine glycosylase 2 family protein [Streptomyces montanisoli]
MPAVASFTPKGPFSLASSIRFLEGFTPASHGHAAGDVLRMAFPADDGRGVIGCTVSQAETASAGAAGAGAPAPVTAEFTVHRGTGPAAHSAARAQIARILSLDVDGTGYPALGGSDPVVAGLQADYPGLRPPCFYTPYEAAAWAVIGNRVRRTQAAAIKARLARDHGRAVDVGGARLHTFPTPEVLRTIDHVTGLTSTKVERLHAIADAAFDGRLDAATLRAEPAESALRALRELPGIGPFSAELILIRGAGHPDIFPTAEPRVHQSMATEYALDAATAADPARLAAIADAWRPYRSWVALLLRARAHDRAAAQARI